MKVDKDKLIKLLQTCIRKWDARLAKVVDRDQWRELRVEANRDMARKCLAETMIEALNGNVGLLEALSNRITEEYYAWRTPS